VSNLIRHDLPPTQAQIILYQTASGAVYERMLAATEPGHRAYCEANRLDYRVEVGVRRGFHAWQASFNRVEYLHELLERGFRGWFVYLDADAVIVQSGFDLRRYLGKREGAALIAAPGGPEDWNINNGIFFLNLGRPEGRELVQRWWRSFHGAITEEMLEHARQPWQPLADGRPFPDDQHLLQMELLRSKDLMQALCLETRGLINLTNGRFIRQFLRATGSPEHRLAAIEEAVALRV
jgi:hypothetical protein